MKKNDCLKIGSYSSGYLAKKFGTPLYVYDKEKIVNNFNKIYNSIPCEPKQIHYAIMCNDRDDVLKTIKKLGGSLQVNSLKEYHLALKLGFDKHLLSVATTNLSCEDLVKFIKHQAHLNLDSIEEIEKYGRIIKKTKGKTNRCIGLRVFIPLIVKNPRATNLPCPQKSRVGINKTDFAKAKKIAKQYNLKIVGLHGYLGSNLLDSGPFKQLNKFLTGCANNFKDLEYINVGGGFGVPNKPKDKAFNWRHYGQQLSLLMNSVSQTCNKKINLKIEPGRSIVAEAGILLTRVTNVKNMDSWQQIGVDCGFGTFARPYLYGWRQGGYHKIIVASKINKKPSRQYTICANSVLQNDFLAEDRMLPKTVEGDLAAILNTGAYGTVMASHFPGTKKPGEIFIDHDIIKVLQKTERI